MTLSIIGWLISGAAASALAGAEIAPTPASAPATGANTTTARQPIPLWFAKAPPLPPPEGAVIRVATVDELLAAVDRVGPGGTVLLADGHYKVPRVIVLEGKKKI